MKGDALAPRDLVPSVACTLVLLGAALMPRPAGAQESAEQQLTAGSSRAWILQRFVRPAEPGDACSAGEIYTFAVTHDLTVSRCEGGHVVQSHRAWSLSQAGNGEATLTISGMGTFLLRFLNPGPGIHRMRLHPTRAARAQPSMDKEFSRDED